MGASGKRILIFGANGRLGAALAREYAGTADVRGLGRAEADLADPAALADLVRGSGADIVINSAAMTNVDVCETERDLAHTVNADAAGAIARASTEVGARLIQISTDYVFSGEGDTPYDEEAAPDPVSCYGRTKLEGEEQVLAAGDRHAVVRVSWVFGPDRDSFVDKALHSALRGEPIKAVADKWSSPTYTLDVAAALRALFPDDAPGGIYHVCNRGVCTWRDWAEEGIKAATSLGLPVKTREVEPLKLADITAMVARRPVYSPMTCGRIEELLGRPLRPWQEAVADYVRLLAEQGRLGIG
ncbi:MAG: dTDP-4-dehydrorhamnose reductase [Chthoniobacterales bacterium]